MGDRTNKIDIMTQKQWDLLVLLILLIIAFSLVIFENYIASLFKP